MARIALALVSLIVLLSSCGGDEGTPAPPATYVGEVAGTPYFLAISLTQEEVVGYVCDGKGTARWYRAPAPEDGRVTLIAEGGETILAQIGDEETTGRVSIAGDAHEFAVRPASAGAGLFRVEDGREVTGWVVLNDGRVKGVTLVGDRGMPAPRFVTFPTTRRRPISPQ